VPVAVSPNVHAYPVIVPSESVDPIPLNVAFRFVDAEVNAAVGNTFAAPLPFAKWSVTCAPESSEE
jgi:hypothetical protein